MRWKNAALITVCFGGIAAAYQWAWGAVLALLRASEGRYVLARVGRIDETIRRLLGIASLDPTSGKVLGVLSELRCSRRAWP
jgi:hypothetical protein